MMYVVSIYNKSGSFIREYVNVRAVNYIDKHAGNVSVFGEGLMTHRYPTDCDMQLLSDGGNYCISGSIIGIFEVQSPNFLKRGGY